MKWDYQHASALLGSDGIKKREYHFNVYEQALDGDMQNYLVTYNHLIYDKDESQQELRAIRNVIDQYLLR